MILNNYCKRKRSSVKKYQSRLNRETISYKNCIRWISVGCLRKYGKNWRKYSQAQSTRKWRRRKSCSRKKVRTTSLNKCSASFMQVWRAEMGIKKYCLPPQWAKNQRRWIEWWYCWTWGQKLKARGWPQGRPRKVHILKGEEGVAGEQIPANESGLGKNERPEGSAEQILWKLGLVWRKDGLEGAAGPKGGSDCPIEPAQTAKPRDEGSA